MPNPTTALAGRIFSIERYLQMLQLIRALCGSDLLMALGQADLHHSEKGRLGGRLPTHIALYVDVGQP